MRLNKHLFISCFHKTDGEVILCSGRRNYFKSLHGGILLPGPALLCYEPDGTHLIAISSLEHLGRMSGPGWEHYPGVILLCGCWGCSLIPLFSHGHGSIGVSTTQFIMNVSVPFAGSLIYLQFLEQKKFCPVNTVYLPCSMQLDCCLGGEWGPFHHWYGLKRDASDAWKGSAGGEGDASYYS